MPVIKSLARSVLIPSFLHLASPHMCGIYFSLSRSRAQLPENETISTLKSRGPDAFRTLRIHVACPDRSGNNYESTFCSSVLALRGNHVEEQPLVDGESGSILCWNGEAWKKDGQEVTGNDSAAVFSALLRATASNSSPSRVAEVLTSITGPFAFVFYDASSSTLYYGRDRLGRRSLILQQEIPNQLVLCSVSTPSLAKPREVSSDQIHYLSLRDSILRMLQTPWSASLPGINTAVPDGSSLTNGPEPETTAALLRHLSASLELRVLKIPDHGKDGHESDAARLAILFSGGLDCTLLARVAHDILPLSFSIDLLNVAFENPRAMKAKANDVSPYEICPDRITGRTTFAELWSTCSARSWRFVAVDIPYSELSTHKATIIRLMKPHNTEMDLSITAALYFAARGQGQMSTSSATSDCSKPYTTPARVLLSGLGADEIFGGYARHAAAFGQNGFPGLIDELSLDFFRIGNRNLGRDDRVISHWGKEVRYPYLDEDFVRFALELPVWEKCGFRHGQNAPKHYEEAKEVEKIEDLEPSKLLLRTALWNLGMKSAAAERKRAIQFGAKTAKMELTSGKRRGTEILEAG